MSTQEIALELLYKYKHAKVMELSEFSDNYTEDVKKLNKEIEEYKEKLGCIKQQPIKA